MKKNVVTLLAVILIPACYHLAYGSSWSLTIGSTSSDYAKSIRQTADGGYIVAGVTGSFGVAIYDAWVLKLNSGGSVVWQKIYGGSGTDYAYSIEQTADGGYIVAGQTTSFGAGLWDFWVLKLNSNGSVAWQKSYGGPKDDYVSSIQQTADGGYIVAGRTDSFGAGNGDAWVLKLNGDGSVAWQNTYGGPGTENAYSVQQTADGGYIVAGHTGSGGYAWVLKLNSNGSVAWQKSYGGPGVEDNYFYSIRQTADGGYFVVGYTNSFGAGGQDAWVLKLNSDGSVAWQKTYGGPGDDLPNSTRQTADGGYIVAGSTTSFGAGGQDAWVLKLNSDGSVAWQKSYGGSGNDQGSSIEQTADGGYIVAGATNSFGGGTPYDLWVLKLDQNGTIMGCSSVAISASAATSTTTNKASADSTAVTATPDIATAATSVTPANSNATPVTNCSYTPSPAKWQKTYGSTGSENANSIRQTDDGGYIVAGLTNSPGANGRDAWVLKLNGNGSVDWQKLYGGASGENATSVEQTFDGGYIVAGSTASFGESGDDVWVLRLHSDGSVAWQKTYGGSGTDVANSIQQTADGGYIVAGYTYSFGAGGGDAWVLKLNSSGSVTWQKSYGGSGNDSAYSVQQTADGGYIVAGYTYSFGAGGGDAWVLKLNSDGSVAWQKSYGGSGTDPAYSIRQTADGGYIALGYTYSFGAGGDDVWVLKLNSDGSVAWWKSYGGSGSDQGNSIEQTADGGYIVAGSTASFGTGGDDAWLLKLKSDGSVAWQKSYGGSGADVAKSVRPTADGGYIVAGYTNSSGAGINDFWVLKLDQNGGITGCDNIATSTAVPQNSAGAVSSTTASPLASSAAVGSSTVTGISTAVTPGAICSASYNQYLLELFITGPGTGRVTSVPPGMNCTTDCSYPFTSGTVTLTELPDPLASFSGWSGACNVSGQVTMDADKRCYAGFTTPADFLGAPRYGYLPLLVNFTDQSTNSPTLWSWDFGDTGTGEGSTETHIYREPGIYTVSLTTTGPGGTAIARKADYVTAALCANKPARIAGPQYYASVTEAYSHLEGSGGIDLQAVEFAEEVTMAQPKTVTLTGGYPCDYGARIADSVIRGSLAIGGSSGAVTIDGVTVR